MFPLFSVFNTENSSLRKVSFNSCETTNVFKKAKMSHKTHRVQAFDF